MLPDAGRLYLPQVAWGRVQREEVGEAVQRRRQDGAKASAMTAQRRQAARARGAHAERRIGGVLVRRVRNDCFAHRQRLRPPRAVCLSGFHVPRTVRKQNNARFVLPPRPIAPRLVLVVLLNGIHAPGASLREMEQHSEATMCRHAHGKESARYGEASGERPNQHIDQVGLEQAEMMGALST